MSCGIQINGNMAKCLNSFVQDCPNKEICKVNNEQNLDIKILVSSQSESTANV